MLSPDIYDAKSLLTQALNAILLLDKYASAANNTRIGKLPEDPGWLAPVRNRMGMLKDAGSSWRSERPDIWAPILLQFVNYATSFSALATQVEQGSVSDDQWIPLLNELLTSQLGAARQETKTACNRLKSAYERFSDVQSLLDDSIQEGWNALATEEKQMVEIAGALGRLHALVGSYEGAITGSVISEGKTAFTTTVSVIYDIVSEAGASFSFMALAGQVFSVGKMFYDIIEGTKKIDDALVEIGELQLEASEAAQAASGTKAVLQLLYQLEKEFLSIKDPVGQIISVWNHELTKVQEVIDALNAGADPQDELDLLTIPSANANWDAILQYALVLQEFHAQEGRPVILTASHPT